jgi:hypothetical protein
LGLLVGFFSQILPLGVDYLLITIWDEDVVTKFNTAIYVITFFVPSYVWPLYLLSLDSSATG